VEIAGARLLEEATIQLPYDKHQYQYIPLLAAGERPVVFVRLSAGDLADDVLRGVLREDGLPGEVRSQFERAGLIGAHHYLLDVGVDPAERAESGRSAALLGCLMAAAALAYLGVKIHRDATLNRS
jgi:hypothetical protein